MLTVGPEPYDAPDSAAMVRALHDDVLARYSADGEDEDPGDAAVGREHFEAPTGCFLVARVDGRLAGCGALRRFDAVTGEVKRMWVVPEARGRGVARAVLAGLEAAAAGFGYTRVRLETGLRQPEAMALYESTGYARIEPYGWYRDSPLSVCYEKPVP